MAKRGRKAFKVSDHLDEVEEYAALGLTDTEICLLLGVSRSTLYKYKGKKKEFTDAIKRGKARNKAELVKKVKNAATRRRNPSIIAQIFLLKSVHGFRDAGPIPIEADPNQDTTAITYKEIDGTVTNG